MNYPEEKPDHGPLDSFVFSLKAGKSAERDLNLRIQALEERIDRITKRVEINGIPLLHHILGLTHDQDDLELLGKAILRVAELMPELDELKKRKAIVDLTMSDPNWVAATFADFTAEVENMTAASEEDEK